MLVAMRAMKIVACSVTVDIETTLKSLKLFSAYRDVVKQFVGIHPEFAAREDLESFKSIFRQNLDSIDGVGEIGLDGTYEQKGVASYEQQTKTFRSMLELAESSHKPVSIHSRRALEDISQILPSYKIKGALLHWFAGSKKQLARAMDMGLYVSYGPVLVYSEEKQVLLKNTLKDRFLVETDGPVRYSRCFDGIPAMSNSCLVSVVASVASVLNLAYDEACALLERNTLAYLSGSQAKIK